MRIEILNTLPDSSHDQVHEAFDRLLPQLSSSAQPLSVEQIEELFDQDCLHLVCAVDDEEKIVGMLSLVVFDIPTGRRAWIRTCADRALAKVLWKPQWTTPRRWGLGQSI